MNRSWLVPLVVIMAFFAHVDRVVAQGFLVKPMRIEVGVEPNNAAEVPLELRLTAGEVPRVLDLSLKEVTQDSQGNWSVIEDETKVDVSKLASCRDWVNLPVTSVTVPPVGVETVKIGIRPPPRARGTYFAAIIAQTRREQQTGLAVVMRFLIPVIIEIQGRPERQSVAMTGVSLSRVDASPGKPGSTTAALSISNDGRTFPRLKGQVRVQRFADGRWKPVSQVDLREVGILPGVTLNLGADMGKRLPSGKYKLTGMLYANGRRLPPFEQDVDFEGDPSVTALATDTSLTMEPPQISIAATAGATRTSVVQVMNDSDEPVEVEASASMPPTLRGVMLGEKRGDALSAAEWLQVSPAKFTIRKGGKQNVRLMARMPREGLDSANYYGLLTLKARYPDGQSGGEATSLVMISNTKVESKADGQVLKVGLAADDASRFIVQARASNVGNVHITPTMRATLLDGQGQAINDASLEGESNLMLPLASREFAGVMDLEKVADGRYMLVATLTFDGGQTATEQLPVRVATEGDRKVATVVEGLAADAARAATEPTSQPSQGQ